jgi:hypothetical protein
MTTPDESDATSPRSLAELARSGFSLVRQPLMRVAYEVHHVNDRPGYLYSVLKERGRGQSDGEAVTAKSPSREEGPERFIETLTTAAHGTGLVVGTRTVANGADATVPLGQTMPVRVQRVRGEARIFTGNAVPNVSFVYDSTHVFEGLIAIGGRDQVLQRRHGAAVLDVMAKVAELAADIAKAPILSLQTPVQLPPKEYFDLSDDGDDTGQETHLRSWPRSSAIAIRFAIALSKPTSAMRLKLLESASAFCDENGFGFWAADTRAGFRAGNWFSICQQNERHLSRYFENTLDPADLEAPAWSMPITFVGPARVGAVKSIVAYLRSYQRLGVIACSMSIIDDVAFIHLQLTSKENKLANLNAFNGRVDHIAMEPDRLRQTEPMEILPSLLTEVAGDPMPGAANAAKPDLLRKVGDFHLLYGPARAVPPNRDPLRRALWLSWEVDGEEAELSVPFLALQQVLHALMPPGFEDPNVEYLICRRVRHAVLRGKGKISFQNRITDILSSDDLQAELSAISERIEEAWRAKLDPTHRVRELTVSWRENWLGHWTSPLD